MRRQQANVRSRYLRTSLLPSHNFPTSVSTKWGEREVRAGASVQSGASKRSYYSCVICLLLLSCLFIQDSDPQTHHQPQPLEIRPEVWRFREVCAMWGFCLCGGEGRRGRQGESVSQRLTAGTEEESKDWGLKFSRIQNSNPTTIEARGLYHTVLRRVGRIPLFILMKEIP